MLRANGKQDRLILWTIVFSAGLVRLAYALTPRVVRWDEAGHLLVASNLVAGRGYSELAGSLDVHLPPFLPLASAALLELGLSPAWATATIHIVTGALLCLPIYALGRAIYGRRAGFIAALLVAVYPALAAWPLIWSTMTESPFLLFVFSGIWAAAKTSGIRDWVLDIGTQETIGAANPQSPIPNPQYRWYILTGAFFGLAYLARPEGLTYFAVIGLFMAGWQLTKVPGTSGSAWRLRSTIAKLALAVIACLLVMAPYLVYLHNATGRWTLSGKVGLILDIAPAYVANDQAAHDRAVSSLDSAGTEIAWLSPDRFNKSLSQYVLANPARFFWQVRQNIAATWHALFHEDLLAPWLVALIALGLFGRPWDRRRWRGEALLWASLLPLAGFWVFFVISRFLVGVLPLAMLWAAAGLDHLAGWMVASVYRLSDASTPSTGSGQALSAAQRSRRTLAERSWGAASFDSARHTTPCSAQDARYSKRDRLLAALPVAVAIALSLWMAPATLRQETAAMPWSHVAAGRWLADHASADAVVMTRHSEIGLYAGRPVIASPNATWPQILAYGAARNARYLVVDNVEVTSLRPQLAPLLETGRDQPLPGVTLVAAFDDSTRRTLVYEIEAGP